MNNKTFYINNISLSLQNKTDILSLDICDINHSLSNSSFHLKTVKNNFIVNKIKKFEILNILSSNYNITKKDTSIIIKIFQIKYNLKKILDYVFEGNEDYKNIIDLDNIFNILDFIAFKYSDKDSGYEFSKEYISIIENLINKIDILISFLIDLKFPSLNNNNYLIKNFQNYILFENIFNISKKRHYLEKQNFFFLTKNDISNNYVLPYERIFSFTNNQKIVFYKYFEEKKQFIIYYSFNFNLKEKRYLKYVDENGLFFNLKKIFNKNIDFNTKNTRFSVLPTIPKYKLFLEKTLKELPEIEDSEYTEDFISIEDNEDIFNNKGDNLELEPEDKEDILSIVNEDKEDIFVNQIDFDKDIEEQLFF